MTEQEFTNLVNEHKATIYTVCYMFSKDEDEVNDLFQDILINLWRGIETFKGDSKVSSWIYRVSLNTSFRQSARSASRPNDSTSTSTSMRIMMPTPSKYKCYISAYIVCALSIVLSFCYGSKASPTTKSGLSLAYQPSTYQYASHAFAKNLKI